MRRMLEVVLLHVIVTTPAFPGAVAAIATGA